MEKVRIQDDLYHAVNDEWLEKAVIPDDKPTAGGFADLAKEVEELLIGDFNKMAESGSYPNAHLENAVKLYTALKNVKKRNKDGMKPILKTLAKFDKIANLSSFNRNLSELVLDGAPLPFSIDVQADMKDTLHHALYVQGPSTILPDTTYYKEGMEQQKAAILGMWAQMAKAVLSQTKLAPELIDVYVEDAIKFDALIASLVKSSEEWSNYIDNYNLFKTSRVSSLVKPVKLKKLLEKLFGFVPETIIVTEPRYFKGFKTVFNEETFVLYKHWAYIKIALKSCPLLSEQLRDIGTSYQRALYGIKAISTPEKHAYQVASQFYSQPVGLYYGQTYFGEEAKRDITEMVEEIVKTYQSRIQKNDFLSEATKEKAILKLSCMKIKMGYPDKVDPLYDQFIYDDSLSLVANVNKIHRLIKEDSFAHLTKDVDRSEWVMPGHMVNACYNPMTNDVTFPAAILQAPFYSLKQTRSQNLGGIGAVIGHEISHAFDNNGAKCDENGNLNNWWTKEDIKKFNQRTKAMAKEFDGIELPWGKVNGTFIVSENIADNGGMGCTLEIMSTMKDANYQEYFINWAKVWCMAAKPEYLQLLLRVDVHAPAILRANMQPRNFQEWYDTFNVKKSDKMYLAPNKRVTIW